MNNRTQHIVFLTPGFSESTTDSTTIPALQVYLKSLKKALPDAKLSIITFQFPFTKKTYYWNGINVIPLNGKNKRWNKLRIWKKALNTLKNLHAIQEISAIHSFWIGECSTVGAQFSKKHNIKHIITVMGQDALSSNRHSKKIINSRSKVVTLSLNSHNNLLKNCNLNSTIIPWHLDVLKCPELQKNEIDILGVGSLNSVKNYSTFIDIISVLIKSKPNLKVRIIGDGKLKNELKTKIKNLDLQNNIKLLGKLERKNVLDYMSKSKILLHTSEYESFGFVFLEALYSGMYITSYNVGLAKPSEKWKVCNGKSGLITACETLLNLTHTVKRRVKLSSEKETINTYINLYNE